jgi:hypothetical protein
MSHIHQAPGGKWSGKIAKTVKIIVIAMRTALSTRKNA